MCTRGNIYDFQLPLNLIKQMSVGNPLESFPKSGDNPLMMIIMLLDTIEI